MATVDLDKLAAELTAAGLRAILKQQPNKDALRVSSGMHGGWFDVWQDGSVTLCNTVTNSQISPLFLCTLDIIRRHVSPVAPDPGLREAIAKALFLRMREVYKPLRYETWEGCNQETFASFADAVLAVLAERGVR